MSKIAILYLQGSIGNSYENIVCYYESIAKELSVEGNKVKLLNMVTYEGRTNEKRALHEIKEFAPDLIITFNNAISEKIIEATSCPIALCDADTALFFNNKHLISKYLERYYMVSFYEGASSDYEKLGFAKDRICTINQATSVRRECVEQDKNISFVGNRFRNYSRHICESIKNDKDRDIYKAIAHTLNTNDYDYEAILSRFCPKEGFTAESAYHLFDQRNYILSSLLDLGLNLYGVGWHVLLESNTALASAFDTTPLYSLKHSQDLYNSSKINISISHPQCRGVYFPWRIYDIMASNGLLITSRSDLLTKQTHGHVTLPMFESPYDVRELCKKYLREDNLRADIVAASNEFIEKNGRWHSNFVVLEQFLGIPLTGQKSHKDASDASVDLIKLNYRDSSYTFNTVACSLLLLVSAIPLAKKLIPQNIKFRVYDYMRNLERYYEI